LGACGHGREALALRDQFTQAAGDLLGRGRLEEEPVLPFPDHFGDGA